MSFSLKFDNGSVGYIAIPDIFNDLHELTYIAESSDQIKVTYDAIPASHSSYLDTRVSDEESFWVIVYATDSESNITYHSVFSGTADSRSSNTVIFNIV